MSFKTGLKIGQILTNTQIKDLFQFKSVSGIRFNKATNTLVLMSDFTKSLCPDKWIGGIYHFTGSGQIGDQEIGRGVNLRLAISQLVDTEVHLFQVLKSGEYVYNGLVTLAERPYTEIQPDKEGNERRVWIFPLKPKTSNIIQKPDLLNFQDEEDYKANGQQARKAFIRQRNGYKGCRVEHYEHGLGTVESFKKYITIKFDNGETKSYQYEVSTRGGYLWFVD